MMTERLTNSHHKIELWVKILSKLERAIEKFNRKCVQVITIDHKTSLLFQQISGDLETKFGYYSQCEFKQVLNTLKLFTNYFNFVSQSLEDSYNSLRNTFFKRITQVLQTINEARKFISNEAQKMIKDIQVVKQGHAKSLTHFERTWREMDGLLVAYKKKAQDPTYMYFVSAQEEFKQKLRTSFKEMSQRKASLQEATQDSNRQIEEFNQKFKEMSIMFEQVYKDGIIEIIGMFGEYNKTSFERCEQFNELNHKEVAKLNSDEFLVSHDSIKDSIISSNPSLNFDVLWNIEDDNFDLERICKDEFLESVSEILEISINISKERIGVLKSLIVFSIELSSNEEIIGRNLEKIIKSSKNKIGMSYLSFSKESIEFLSKIYTQFPLIYSKFSLFISANMIPAIDKIIKSEESSIKKIQTAQQKLNPEITQIRGAFYKHNKKLLKIRTKVEKTKNNFRKTMENEPPNNLNIDQYQTSLLSIREHEENAQLIFLQEQKNHSHKLKNIIREVRKIAFDKRVEDIDHIKQIKGIISGIISYMNTLDLELSQLRTDTLHQLDKWDVDKLVPQMLSEYSFKYKIDISPESQLGELDPIKVDLESESYQNEIDEIQDIIGSLPPVRLNTARSQRDPYELSKAKTANSVPDENYFSPEEDSPIQSLHSHSDGFITVDENDKEPQNLQLMPFSQKDKNKKILKTPRTKAPIKNKEWASEQHPKKREIDFENNDDLFLDQIKTLGAIEDQYEEDFFQLDGSTKSKKRTWLSKHFKIEANDSIVESFACAIKLKLLLQGRMYITKERIFFSSYFNQSTIFGRGGTRIMIPFSDVVEIEKKYNALIFDNSIKISTHNTQFFFTSFCYRDQAFDMLNEYLKAYRNLGENSPPSNPILTSYIENFNFLKELSDIEFSRYKALKGSLEIIEGPDTLALDATFECPIQIIFIGIFQRVGKFTEFNFGPVIKQRNFKIVKEDEEVPEYFTDLTQSLGLLLENGSEKQLNDLLMGFEKWKLESDSIYQYDKDMYDAPNIPFMSKSCVLTEKRRLFFLSPNLLFVDILCINDNHVPYGSCFQTHLQLEIKQTLSQPKNHKLIHSSQVKVNFRTEIIKKTIFRSLIMKSSRSIITNNYSNIFPSLLEHYIMDEMKKYNTLIKKLKMELSDSNDDDDDKSYKQEDINSQEHLQLFKNQEQLILRLIQTQGRLECFMIINSFLLFFVLGLIAYILLVR